MKQNEAIPPSVLHVATVNSQTSLQELKLNQTSISGPEISLTAYKLPKNINYLALYKINISYNYWNVGSYK